jgi:hypothetical protein
MDEIRRQISDFMENYQAFQSDEADRRATKRFPIERPVSYKFARGRTWSEATLGKTLNISSTGILFSGQYPVIPGKRLELSVSWPVRLDGKCSLKLVIRGHVVRCVGTEVAAKIEKYEFHTQSAKALRIPVRIPQGQHACVARLAV